MATNYLLNPIMRAVYFAAKLIAPKFAARTKDYILSLQSTDLNKKMMEEQVFISNEANQTWPFIRMGFSLHFSRIRWIKGLPKACRIVDLGGAARDCKVGALIAMGYPYSFQELIIVEPILEARHPLYQQGYENITETLEYKGGIVRYYYSSMNNLAEIANGSVDFVNSGQSIEHITPADGDLMLQEVLRILKPGGIFCFDTPNGRATRLQQADFIDPDHKIEYIHIDLKKKIEKNGFILLESKGINWLGKSFEKGIFSEAEVTANPGLYDDIENCYLLAYRCQKPV